jgi:hypothetical protein
MGLETLILTNSLIDKTHFTILLKLCPNIKRLYIGNTQIDMSHLSTIAQVIFISQFLAFKQSHQQKNNETQYAILENTFLILNIVTI